jgi:glycerol-3-phosphate O-acyltransferase
VSAVTTAADRLVEEGLWAAHFRDSFLQLYTGFLKERGALNLPLEPVEEHFEEYIAIIEHHLKEPFLFEPIHPRATQPIDFFAFGMRQAKLMLDMERSRVDGMEIAKQAERQIEAGENVIIFSNHQTELDCHLVSALIERECPLLADRMIWVAGDRVLTDPVAVPVSLGLHLICIYSKKHIDHPPEEKQKKLHHNRQTMRQTRDLLAKGGQCIVLFPSGGRDRPNASGEIDVAPFDPASIEMFRMLAAHSKTPTHFYPLALSTYRYLPPPSEVEQELGEHRICHYVPVSIAFDKEIDFDKQANSLPKEKQARRAAVAEAVWQDVHAMYHTL